VCRHSETTPPNDMWLWLRRLATSPFVSVSAVTQRSDTAKRHSQTTCACAVWLCLYWYCNKRRHSHTTQPNDIAKQCSHIKATGHSHKTQPQTRYSESGITDMKRRHSQTTQPNDTTQRHSTSTQEHHTATGHSHRHHTELAKRHSPTTQPYDTAK